MVLRYKSTPLRLCTNALYVVRTYMTSLVSNSCEGLTNQLSVAFALHMFSAAWKRHPHYSQSTTNSWIPLTLSALFWTVACHSRSAQALDRS